MSSKKKEIEKKKEPEFVRVTPPVDIYENDEEFLILAEMPGVAAGEVSINHEPPTLTVEGRQPADERVAPVLFSRSFHIPDTVMAESIDASLKDGVLTITLKKAEDVRPRKIEVQAG